MNKKNLIITICTIMALCACAVVCIPFAKEGFAEIEGLVKFVVVPALVILLMIPAIAYQVKGVNEKSSFPTAGIIISAAGYISALSLFMVGLALRNNLVGGGIPLVPFDQGWLAILAIFGSLCVFALLCGVLLSLVKTKAKSKIGTVLLDFLLCIIVIAAAAALYLHTKDYSSVDFALNASDVMLMSIAGAVIIFLVLGIATILLGIKDSKEELAIQKNKADIDKCQDDIYAGMYKFAREQLIARGYVLDQENVVFVEKEIVKQTEPKIIEKIIEVEKVVERIVEVEKPVEKVVEVEKPVEKIIEIEKSAVVVEPLPVVEPVEKVAKERKIIEPRVSVIAAYATSTYPDVKIVYGKTEEDFKIYRDKKLVIEVQTTNSDYRIIFQRKPISASKLIVKYPTLITKPKSPKGDQWFKLVSKGEFDEEELFGIVKFSYKFIIDEEEKAELKKQKDKEKAALKKQKEKEKAKEKAALEKAKAKNAKEKAPAKAKVDVNANDIAMATAQVAENKSEK